MNYSEFTDVLVKKAKEAAGEGREVFVNQVIKNNDTRIDGLVIREKDQHMSPSFYINDCYEKYKNGTGIDRILDEILSCYEANRKGLTINKDFFSSYQNVKDRVVYKLINIKKNSELLKTTPHKKYLDLAVVFYVLMPDTGNETATALIHNEMLKVWNIDTDTLAACAEENTPKLFPAVICKLENVMERMSGKKSMKNHVLNKDETGTDDCSDICPDEIDMTDPCKSMFVLTNKSGMNGAACMRYDKQLSCFGKKIKNDFYILPSSVHEVLLVPKSEGLDKEALSQMVRDINETGVSPMEVLSDHVYEYDYKEDMVKL